jgi:NAD(P)-dependent dehydrogenase (short-subunit alcohol dehydrogenase family)
VSEVVVVTGASAGVGRACAVECARHGAGVGLIARGRRGLEGAAREVRDAGGRAHVAVADVADPEAVEAAAAEIESALGPIDVWVNNAMVTVYGRLEDLTPAEFRRITDVTYHGSVWGTRAGGPPRRAPRPPRRRPTPTTPASPGRRGPPRDPSTSRSRKGRASPWTATT